MKLIRRLAVLLLPVMLIPLAGTPTPASASVVPAAGAWAFCGVWQAGDANAQAKANAMANSGITATHGPCFAPPAGYTPANPGSRYGTPADMFGTMVGNANAGMKTIIYDARFWGSVADQNAAEAYWAPHAAWIQAIDMGDEFPCWDAGQWNTLINRAATVWNRFSVNPASPLYYKFMYTTNYSPQYTIPAYGQNCVQRAFNEVPGAGLYLGYDDYDVNSSNWWANWIATNVSGPNALVCSISTTQNTTGHTNSNPSTLTQASIKNTMGLHRANGCDFFLIFNAGTAYGDPIFSGLKSLHAQVWPFARTDWGLGVLQGTTYSWP